MPNSEAQSHLGEWRRPVRRPTWWASVGPRTVAMVVLLCLGVAGSAPAAAADDKKADREARRAQMLEQRLEQERSQWQVERADLQKKLSDSETALSASKATYDSTSVALEKSSRDRAALQRQLADLNKRLTDQQASAESERTTKQAELDRFTAARAQERTALNSRLQVEGKSLETCTEHNDRLVKIGHELLQRLHDKGLIDIVKQEEPLLGIGDVEMFNVVQNYRDEIDSEQVAPASRTR